MTRVLRFGDYAFEDTGTEFGTNFGDLVLRTTRLPGLSGGFDSYGSGPAPREVGNVRLNLMLKADTPAAMQNKRDALLRLASKPRRALFVEPTDASAPRRFCKARVSNIQWSERYAALPQATQRVTVNWQASDPRWYSKSGMWYLNDGVALDGGRTVQGAAAVEVEDGDIITVTNAGTAPTPPRIQIEPVASGDWITEWFIGDPYVIGMEGLFIGEAPDAAVQGFGLRRLSEDGRVQSEWFWLGTVREGEQLIVDHAACRVRHESKAGTVNGYPDFYATAGFAFPPLEPGENRFQVFGTFTGKVRLTIDFLDAWI